MQVDNKHLIAGFRKLLSSLLIFLGNLGINFQVEADALREDFVSSDAFISIIYTVFDEADIDRNELLDASEFYTATLLCYNKLNNIKFTGVKKLPGRKNVMALFYRFIRLQKAAEDDLLAEEIKKQENQGFGFQEKLLPSFSNALNHFTSYFAKDQTNAASDSDTTPDLDESDKNDIKPEPGGSLSDEIKLAKLKITLIVGLAIFTFETLKVLFSSNFSFNTLYKIFIWPPEAVALLLSILFFLFIFYEPSEAHIQTHDLEPSSSTTSLPPFSAKTKQKRMKKAKTAGPTYSSLRHGRANTLRKEEFIMEHIQGDYMKRPTFVYMCQEIFNGLVFAETYRILVTLILLPFCAYQLKSLLDSFNLSETASNLNDMLNMWIGFKIPVLPKDVSLTLAMGTVMACAPYLVDPVVNFFMWKDALVMLEEDIAGVERKMSKNVRAQEDIKKVLGKRPSAPKVWLKKEMEDLTDFKVHKEKRKEARKSRKSRRLDLKITKFTGLMNLDDEDSDDDDTINPMLRRSSERVSVRKEL